MAKTIINLLYNKISMHRGDPPMGWLTVLEYAKRLGLASSVQINKAVRDGRIPTKHLAINEPVGGQKRIIINWDDSIYNFLLARKAAFRPADFVENPERQYKPINPSLRPNVETIKNAKSKLNGEIVDAQLVNEDMTLEPVIDITSARYRKEQLEIQKRQLELRQAANELLQRDQVEALLASIAAELNGNASRAVPSWSTKLTEEEDPQKTRQLMKQMFTEIFEPLESYTFGENKK